MKSYFHLSELCVTDTGQFNYPPINGFERGNLERLMSVLDVLRHLVSCPIYVTSGYRNEYVNAFVGGVETSLHLQGRAADIKCKNMEHLKEICSLFHKRGIFTEFIEYPTFIHVAI